MRVVRIEVPIGVRSGTANAWLLPDPPVTLVDCGPDTPETLDALRAGLRGHGLSLRDVEQVLVTHGHLDHGGASGRVAASSSAKVFVHPDDALVLRDPVAWRAVRTREAEAALAEAGARPEDFVEVRARIDAVVRLVAPAPRLRAYPDGPIEAGGALLEAIHAPGHTPGSVVLHAPREQMLFTGDVLLKKIVTNANALSKKERGGLGRHLATLERLLALPPGAVHPGHGDSFDDAGGAIGRDLAHHARRSDKLRAAMRRGPQTARALADAMFLGRPEVVFALSEVAGHLALLAAHGLAVEDRSAPASVWSLTPAGAAESEE